MQLIHVVDMSPEQYVAKSFHKRMRPPAKCPHCRRVKTLWALGYYSRNLSRMLAHYVSDAELDYLRDAFVKIGLRPESADDTDDFNPTKNILRHSACTYLNLIHGAATAARWAGHAEKIQQEHYIGLRDEDEANHWIKLTPDAVHRIQGLRIEYDNARETLETSHEGMKQDWPGTLIQFTDFLAEK